MTHSCTSISYYKPKKIRNNNNKPAQFFTAHFQVHNCGTRSSSARLKAPAGPMQCRSERACHSQSCRFPVAFSLAAIIVMYSGQNVQRAGLGGGEKPQAASRGLTFKCAVQGGVKTSTFCFVNCKCFSFLPFLKKKKGIRNVSAKENQ